MSKSDRPEKKSQSPPILENVIEIDEGIFGGRISDRLEKQQSRLESFIRGIKDFEFINESDDDDDENDDDLIDEDFDEDEFEEKIATILGTENLEVNEANLKKYLAYLKENVKMPCQLTPIEDFEWEEYYLYGPGSKKEYEKLKKTKPSYSDTFKFMGFNDYMGEELGIMVAVQRTTDKRKFTIPLCELEVPEETSPNYALLDDYVVWFVNYR